MRISNAILLSGAILLLTACISFPKKPAQVQGDGYAYTKAYLEWMINRRMEQQDTVGLSIALVDDQQILWSRGFGFADKEYGIPAASHTVYRAGSITKLFTAIAVMQLAVQGKLDIDRPLREYLPEFQINTRFDPSREVTPRLMMTHHSGLPSDIVNGMWGDENASFADLPLLLKEDYLAFEPGQVRAYSNVAFGLLGLLIERVSGISYGEYIETHILKPAGMRQAYVGELQSGGQNARGYYEGKAHDIPVLRDQPAGALNASVEDLARFAQLIFRIQSGEVSAVASRSTLAEMQSYQDGHSIFDLAPAFGLAWVIDDSRGDEAGLVLSHDGSTPMFSSQLLTLPKHKLAVVVMANSADAGRMTAEIANKAMELMLESKTGIVPQDDRYIRTSLPLRGTDSSQLPGSWSSIFGWVVIAQDDDELSLQIDDLVFNLVRSGEGLLHLEYKLFGLIARDLGQLSSIGVEYKRIGERELLVGYVNGKPRQLLAQKIRPHTLPDAWQARIGHYRAINVAGAMQLSDVELAHRDGVLVMDGMFQFAPGGEAQPLHLPLQPVGEGEAIVQGIGRSFGGTLRVVKVDGLDHLAYSGFLLRPCN